MHRKWKKLQPVEPKTRIEQKRTWKNRNWKSRQRKIENKVFLVFILLYKNENIYKTCTLSTRKVCQNKKNI